MIAKEKMKQITDTVTQSIKETFKLLMTQNIGSAIKESRMSNNIKKIYQSIRPLIYFIWFILITWVALCIYQMGLDTNTQGDSCDPHMWREGQIYQWVWSNQPCVYTVEFLIGYIFYIQLYLLYDYIRRKIVGFNPAIFWRMSEVGIWFAINWGYLLWLTATDYGTLNGTMWWTSFIGTLLFFVPIILLANGVRFLSNRAVLWTFFGILMTYFGLVSIAIIYQ